MEYYTAIKKNEITVCRKMDGHVKQNKPESKRQTARVFSCVESRFKKKNKDMIVEGGLIREAKEGQ
jgi:hypothetical protein